MVLPAGTSVPPLPYLLVLAVGVAAVWALLRRVGVAFTEGVVLALTPWMATGAALHAAYVLGIAPAVVAPLLGTPAVYVTTAVLAGATWAVADAAMVAPARLLAATGTALLVLVAATVLVVGGVTRVAAPVVGLVVGVALGAAVWAGLRRVRPVALAASGRVGLLVLVAHGLDGVTTAIGVDVLGFGERTPASRAVMQVAAALPTAHAIGVGWLFVLAKLAVAGAILLLVAGYVREEPGPGRALLGLIAAVGLGPGTYNLLLYVVAH